MSRSKDENVQQFLEGISMFDHDKFISLNTIRKMVFKNYPETEEKMMYGGIMFSLESEDFCGLFVRKNHISFEFSNGYMMNDPDKFLEGSGKFRRHLKIKSIEDIQTKTVNFFVKQAV